ncbi:hypothetical protein C2S51_007152 [Perilla frutescens var. frutescens]|nr:hypothetical protein C2S51_007152 [Perilla frutescens var. frutescens]
MKKGDHPESSTPPPLIPKLAKITLNPSKAPMESSSDPRTQCDPKYQYEALSKHFQKRAARTEKHDGDEMLNNIKMSIQEFEGLHDPDLYLDWEPSWWEMQKERRHRDRYLPMDTWQEMKELMQGRFILVHYERELENKLNRIKQDVHSVEEYHKELETALNRVGKEVTINVTIIQYIEGLNPDIICEVKLKDFNSVEEMVHYASIVERQLREGRRRSHHSPDRPSGVSIILYRKPAIDPSLHRCHLQDRPTHDLISPHHHKLQPQTEPETFNATNVKNEIESASEDEDQPLVNAKKELEMPRFDADEEGPEIPHDLLDVIDNGSVINGISQYADDKLALNTMKNLKPYKFQCLTDRGEIKVTA